jgi:hypothetical protein
VSTAFDVIRDAIVAALTTPTAIADDVRAARDFPMPAEHASGLLVRIGPFEGDAYAITGGPMLWRARFGLEIRARVAGATDAEALVLGIFSAVFTRLSATTPPAGVEAWMVSVGGRIELSEAENPIATLLLTLSASFRTQPGSLALAA